MKLSEILDNLQQPIPPNFISQKPAKNKKTGEISSIPYVAWFDLCALLDCRCGLDGWSWQIKGVQQVGKRLTLTGVLTVYGEDRSLTREATGCEDVDCTSYGDPSQCRGDGTAALLFQVRIGAATVGQEEALTATAPDQGSQNRTAAAPRTD